MGRTLRVVDSPAEIIPDRPKKPVRGRKARMDAYRAAREPEAVEKPPTPRRAAVEVVQSPAPGPIIRAKKNPAYDVIPYCLDQNY